MGLSNYPAGVTNADPHFHEDWPERCPSCGAEVGDSIYCEVCEAILDPVEAAAEKKFAAEAEMGETDYGW